MKVGIEFESNAEAIKRYDAVMARLKEEKTTSVVGKKPNLNRFDRIEQRIHRLYHTGAVAKGTLEVGWIGIPLRRKVKPLHR